MPKYWNVFSIEYPQWFLFNGFKKPMEKLEIKGQKEKGKGTDWPLSFLCVIFSAKQTFPNVQEALFYSLL